MRRNGTLEEISDGHLYGPDDLVKLGCGDCEGCSACCHGMEALMLDPLDIFRLTTGLGRPFEDFLEKELELAVADGLIAPRMRMKSGGTGQEQPDACAFLNEQGRCSIHSLRPGICRLFPLGRYYHDGEFSYILQKDECRVKNRYKVKVSRWMDEPEPEKNRRYILEWHRLQKELEETLAAAEENGRRQLLLYVLKLFYQLPYEPGDFYEQFEERLRRARRDLEGILPT